ncbi:MAG: FecR domain-containing protein [Cyanobacteria bacterium P01_E01_bin.6]
MRNHHFILQACVVLGLFAVPSASAQQSLQVRANRWLRVTELTGNVRYQTGGTLEPAAVGDRLQRVGDGLRTGGNSTAVLDMDMAIGSVSVAPNTVLQIQQLTTTSDGARLTRINVTEGHAQLRVRRFTNPNSTLEIETPAGVAAVRGTDFGFNVDQEGLMSLATVDGQVWVEAQGNGVSVNPGFQTLVIPGFPPEPPQPIATELYFRPRVITDNGNGTAEIVGFVPPGTLIYVRGQSHGLTTTGHIDITAPISSNRRVPITLQAPSGTQQTYQIAIP